MNCQKEAKSAFALPASIDIPFLDEGMIHLWSFTLDGAHDRCLALSSLLDLAESERARRFLRPIDESRFCVAHGMVRLILAGYVGVGPSDLRFRVGPAGKPALEDRGGIEFNLSHSGAWGLLAVTSVGPVGADIEFTRDMPELMQLARANFAPGEVAALERLPQAQRRDAFFAAWTRKEAFVKAIGDGLPFGLDSFEVELRPDYPAQILQVGLSSDAARSYSLHALQPVRGAWAAVVTIGRATSVIQMNLGEDWQRMILRRTVSTHRGVVTA